jgi:hypothetical protein
MFGRRENKDVDEVASAMVGAMRATGRIDAVTAIAAALRKLTYEEFITLSDELENHLSDTQKPIDVALSEWAKARTTTPVDQPSTSTAAAESTKAPAPAQVDQPPAAADANKVASVETGVRPAPAS